MFVEPFSIFHHLIYGILVGNWLYFILDEFQLNTFTILYFSQKSYYEIFNLLLPFFFFLLLLSICIFCNEECVMEFRIYRFCYAYFALSEQQKIFQFKRNSNRNFPHKIVEIFRFRVCYQNYVERFNKLT